MRFMDSHTGLKLTAKIKRKVYVEACWRAHVATLKTIDVISSFRSLGQLWDVPHEVKIRSLPGFTYVPEEPDVLTLGHEK